MWLSLVEEANRSWFSIEPLTLIHPYMTIQKSVVSTLTPYSSIIKRYSEKTKRPVEPLTEEYLKENPDVAEENVALLKNSIELWRTATKISDSIAPILVHYSWHCFNSFFIYSLFRWNPTHSKSHGVRVTLSDDIGKIKIQVLKHGLFKRLIDTWTLLGTSLAFSPELPVVVDGDMQFEPNARYILDSNNEISLNRLLEFAPSKFELELHSNEGWKKVGRCPFLANSVQLPNQLLQSYLTLFVASSIARYRPILWHSILYGKTRQESDFALTSSTAALDYTVGEKRGLGLVSQVTRILKSIEEGHFFLQKPDGKPIR